MKVVAPEGFLVAKQLKTGRELYGDFERGPLFVRGPSFEGVSPSDAKRKKPFVVTVTDTSGDVVDSSSSPPQPSPISQVRIATTATTTSLKDDGEFWRYFQNASQLAFVVPGGGDAVIGRMEARQLLANFRGASVESIAKTDSGLMHVCGLSVRQLHTFVSSLWSLGSVGMSVIRDLSIGSTKGSAKTLLLKSQKKRIDEHIRSHSLSVFVPSEVHERDDYLELGFEGATREELPSPMPSPLPSVDCSTTHARDDMRTRISFSMIDDMDFDFEDDDEVKWERPSMRSMKSSELAHKMEQVRMSRLGVDSATLSSSFSSFSSGQFGIGMSASFSASFGHSLLVPGSTPNTSPSRGPLHSISSSLMSWAKEEAADDRLSLGGYDTAITLEDAYDSETSFDSCGDSDAEKTEEEVGGKRKALKKPHSIFLKFAASEMRMPKASEMRKGKRGLSVTDLAFSPRRTSVTLLELLSQESVAGTGTHSGDSTPMSVSRTTGSDEIIYLDKDTLLSPGKSSLSLSVSLSERLAIMMHAPVGV